VVAAGTQGRTGVPRIAAAFLGAQIGSGREQGKKSTAIAPISANRAQKGRFSAKAWSTGTHGDTRGHRAYDTDHRGRGTGRQQREIGAARRGEANRGGGAKPVAAAGRSEQGRRGEANRGGAVPPITGPISSA
jgi:hypothetical protein